MIILNNSFQNEFGERVRLRREQLGITQEELASKLGYKHKTSVSKIENGVSSVPSTKVVELAKVLDVSVQYLMGKEKIDAKKSLSHMDDEQMLVNAWSKATFDEKMQIYYVLKKYGMPQPNEKDTIAISVS